MSRPQETLRQVRPLITVAVVVTALLMAYVGTYFAMLRSKVYDPVGVDAATGINRHFIAPEYRLFEPTSAVFFRPVHFLDRHIRSEYWDTVEKTDGTERRNP